MYLFIRLVFLSALGLVGLGALQAQEVSIQARLDRAEMMTGQQAVIDVVIRTDNLAQTRFYLSEEEQAEPRFRILNFGAIDTIDLDDRLKEIQAKMLITSFDSTLVVIPPIVVETPTGKAQTEPLALKVVQPEVDLEHPDEFKPIKAPWVPRWRWQDVLLQVLMHPAFWVVLILLIGAYSYYRYRKMPPYEFKLEDPNASASCASQIAETPLERIERELARIEAAAYWQRGAYKQLYTEVIESLKQYIYAVKGWHVLEMTTSELNDFFYRRDEDKELRASLEELQREADLSKFAKGEPTEQEARHSLEQARLWAQRAQNLWVVAQSPKLEALEPEQTNQEGRLV